MAVYLRGSCKKNHRHSGKCMTYYYDFMVRRKRYKQAIPEARTQAKAEQVETIERHKVFERKYGKASGDRNFADFVNKTYLVRVKVNNRSFRENERHAKMWVTYFGKEVLGDITQEMIERVRSKRIQLEKSKDLKRRPATINREMGTLSGIFSLAIEYEELAFNPCRRIEALREDNKRTRHLSFDEEARLMAQLVGQREHLRDLVFVDIYTGLRKSELLNLRKDKVDFNLNVIHVTQTKSGKDRTVPIDENVREAISRAIRQTSSEYVFTNPETGKPYGDVKKAFSHACRDAQIFDFRFHDLRHTFGTRLADAGVDVVKIKELMGHQSIETTMRYLHTTDKGKRAAITELSEYRRKRCPKFVPNAVEQPEEVAVSG